MSQSVILPPGAAPAPSWQVESAALPTLQLLVPTSVPSIQLESAAAIEPDTQIAFALVAKIE
ncbi:MAG: hypothetical protein KAS17_05555 [Victivallaceae bacterium]|nr:hypothetical protein [Victivallaceae bacterium]